MSQWGAMVVAFLIGVVVFVAGWFARRLVDRSKIVSAEELAEKIVREAQREAETQKKAAVLEAKDEWYKAKSKFEEDTQDEPRALGITGYLFNYHSSHCVFNLYCGL